MSNKVNCKHCGSSNVLAVDNMPLYHPTEEDMTDDYRYDSELYVEFKCFDYGGYSNTTFHLIPKN